MQVPKMTPFCVPHFQDLTSLSKIRLTFVSNIGTSWLNEKQRIAFLVYRLFFPMARARLAASDGISPE